MLPRFSFPSVKQIALPLIAALALTACEPGTQTEAGRAGKTVSTGTADLGGPFTLVDQSGAAISEADLLGQPTLLYFGFSFCPDVCPTSLFRLGRAQELMGEAGDDVRYVMISVDPERDTPQQLAQYVTSNGFPIGLQGWTGTVEQIDAVKAAYKVYAQKAPLDDSEMEYTVDHQDIVFLLGSDGLFADFFTARSTPQDIAVRTRAQLKKEAANR